MTAAERKARWREKRNSFVPAPATNDASARNESELREEAVRAIRAIVERDGEDAAIPALQAEIERRELAALAAIRAGESLRAAEDEFGVSVGYRMSNRWLARVIGVSEATVRRARAAAKHEMEMA